MINEADASKEPNGCEVGDQPLVTEVPRVHIESRRTRAAEAAYMWGQQYIERSGEYSNPRVERIHADLIALGDAPMPEDVDRVIGNGSWTSVECNECESSVERVVRFGELPDYESSTAWVCEACLRRALEAMTASQ